MVPLLVARLRTTRRTCASERPAARVPRACRGGGQEQATQETARHGLLERLSTMAHRVSRPTSVASTSATRPAPGSRPSRRSRRAIARRAWRPNAFSSTGRHPRSSPGRSRPDLPPGPFCEHRRIRSRCKDCGGGSICEHQRIRSTCRECRAAADESMPAGLEEL